MAQITAGIKFKYGSMGVSGTKPSEWTAIPDVTEIPEIGGDVDTIESTTLDNMEYKTYISALKDTGGAISVSAMDTPEFRTAWAGFVTAAKGENGAAACIEIPAPLNKRIWFPASAVSLGFGGAQVNSALTISGYFTVLGEPQEEALGA